MTFTTPTEFVSRFRSLSWSWTINLKWN
jgi:hypothetical protein